MAEIADEAVWNSTDSAERFCAKKNYGVVAINVGRIYYVCNLESVLCSKTDKEQIKSLWNKR